MPPEETGAAIVLKTVRELRDQEAKLYRTASDAADKRNYQYAIDMYRTLLRRAPGLLEVRQKLREAQFAHQGNRASTVRQILANFAVLPQVFRAYSLINSGKFAVALDNAETAMTFDPTAVVSCSLLVKAAEAAECYEIAEQTLEWAAAHHPTNPQVLDWLGRTYVTLKKGKKAVSLYAKLKELEPHHRQWADRQTKAMAVAALEDGWEKAADSKEGSLSMVRDRKEAALLEQSERVKKTEQGMEMEVAALLKQCAERDTVDARRRLAELYTQAKDYDQAMAQYGRCRELAGVFDPAIERSMTEVATLQYDARLADLEAQANVAGVTEADLAKLREQYAALTTERDEMLLDRLRQRVKHSPTAYQDRLDLGLLLFDHGLVDEALGHFQFLLKHPRFGIEAGLHAGRCFASKGVNDLAIEQFQRVINEISGISDVKKEAYYALAKCYTAAGKTAEARDCYKAIYAVDMAFRDVKQIIEGTSA